jgi:hypothetical protein
VFSGERSEGGEEADGLARALSEAGVVGIVDQSSRQGQQRKGKIVQSDPNSNVISSRTVLPTLLGSHTAGSDEWLVTAVFALPTAQGQSDVNPKWREEWDKRPDLPEVVAELMK